MTDADGVRCTTKCCCCQDDLWQCYDDEKVLNTASLFERQYGSWWCRDDMAKRTARASLGEKTWLLRKIAGETLKAAREA